MIVNNPQFPHTCKIYRIEGETSFVDGIEKVLYEGKCRKWGATTLRTFKTQNVIKGDYALSLPGIVGAVRAGDFVDVTDYMGTITRCLVSDNYPTNLGTHVFFNHPKN